MEKIRRWRQDNPGRVAEITKNWRLRNPEKVRELYRNWTSANPEKAKQRLVTWRSENKDLVRDYIKRRRAELKEHYKQRNREYHDNNRDRLMGLAKQWRKNNPEKVRSYKIAFILRRRKAMPSWLSPDDIELIKNKYAACRQQAIVTGIPHHVDHIVPLKGKAVCGLHVPWNLQVIPAEINLRKSNIVPEHLNLLIPEVPTPSISA